MTITEQQTDQDLILRSGGNHFCAGHNLKEMSARRADADGGLQDFQYLFATCSAMMPCWPGTHVFRRAPRADTIYDASAASAK